MSARWSRVEAVVREALSRAPVDREEFVDAACGEDLSLRAEVRSLLANEADASSFLEGPPAPGGEELLGRQLGPYRVDARLGAGGMGEVYRARDTRLDRDVAIKVLPGSLAQDPDRLARLGREARLLAALNHPHIAAIYGVEEADGIRALVLELVEGETLAARMQRGPLPVPEALRLAVQLADALAAAHDKGIVHRDFKPANIQLAPRGGVKVLDFGIARAATGETGGTTVATREGSVIGTPAYMSPEQARGEAVDRQADVWAFGCVLFEMLSGARAFPGATTSDVLVAVLDRDPPWSTLSAAVPAHVVVLLRKCLQKDKALRLRDMGDVRLLLDDVLQPTVAAATPARREPSKLGVRERVVWVSVAAILATTAIGTWLRWRPLLDSEARVSHLSLPLESGADFVNNAPYLALSPDGRNVVYGAGRGTPETQLFLRPLDSLVSTPLPGTTGAFSTVYSPDGRWLAFVADGWLKKIPASGGTPQNIFKIGGGTLLWDEGGAILFGDSSENPQRGIVQVRDDGSSATDVTTLNRAEGQELHAAPQVLPDRRTLLFTVGLVTGSGRSHQLVTAPLAGGPQRILLKDAAFGLYIGDGILLYQRGSEIFATRFDPATLSIAGPAVAIVESVKEGHAQRTWAYVNGTLVYKPAGEAQRELVWVSRTGGVQPVGAPARQYSGPRVSPDGQRIAVNVISGNRNDVYVYDRRLARLENVTNDGVSRSAAWMPDGERMLVIKQRGPEQNIFMIGVDGSAAVEQLTRHLEMPFPGEVTPDSRTLLFSDRGNGGSFDVWAMSLQGDRTPRALVSTPIIEGGARLDRDGLRVAYSTSVGGRSAVKITTLAAGGPTKLIASEPAREPIWARNGRELFYRDGNHMMAVAFDGSGSLVFSKPQSLFNLPFVQFGISTQYDVAPDGRFLLMREVSGGLPHFNIVQGLTTQAIMRLLR